MYTGNYIYDFEIAKENNKNIPNEKMHLLDQKFKKLSQAYPDI